MFGAHRTCEGLTKLDVVTFSGVASSTMDTLTQHLVPMDRATLLGLRDEAFAAEIHRLAAHIVNAIYQNVRNKALVGEKKFIHIQTQHVIGKFYDCVITFDHVRDHILAKLQELFVGCKIEYVERRPAEDAIFGSKGPSVRKLHSDGVDRAIVINWE